MYTISNSRRKAWESPVAPTRAIPTQLSITTNTVVVPKAVVALTVTAQRRPSSAIIKRGSVSSAAPAPTPPLSRQIAWGSTRRTAVSSPAIPVKVAESETKMMRAGSAQRPVTASSNGRLTARAHYRKRSEISFSADVPDSYKELVGAYDRGDEKTVVALQKVDSKLGLSLEHAKRLSKRVGNSVLAPQITNVIVQTPQPIKIRAKKYQVEALQKDFSVNPSATLFDKIADAIKRFFTRADTEIDAELVMAMPIKNILEMRGEHRFKNLRVLKAYSRESIEGIPINNLVAACMYGILAPALQKAEDMKALLEFLHHHKLLGILDLPYQNTTLRKQLEKISPKKEYLEIIAYLAVYEKKSNITKISAFTSAIPNFPKNIVTAINVINFLAAHNSLDIIKQVCGLTSIYKELRKIVGKDNLAELNVHLAVKQKELHAVAEPKAQLNGRRPALEPLRNACRTIAVIGFYAEDGKRSAGSCAQRSTKPIVANHAIIKKGPVFESLARAEAIYSPVKHKRVASNSVSKINALSRDFKF